jgi:hypothetical protein
VYLEGRSSETERAQVEAHLAACSECYDLFVECARELGPTPTPSVAEEGGAVVLPMADRNAASPWRRVSSAWWLGAVAALVLVGIGALVTVNRRAPGAHGSSEYVELVASLANDRVVSGRLSGDVPYAPVSSDLRGPGDTAIDPRVQAAAALVQRELSHDDGPGARALIGVSQLVTGQVGPAVATLERSVAADASNAGALNDLAVAYLERARAGGGAPDLQRALEAATRAASLSPGLASARFNRALALERLDRKSEAADAWREFLSLDSSSGWADEARRRLAALAR